MTINFNKPFLTNKEESYFRDMIGNNKFYGDGKYNDLCRKRIIKEIKSENVLMTDSCTSSLDIAAMIISQKVKKKTILCPSYTFSSTASAFLKAGFNIKFIDINKSNLMIDIKTLDQIDLSDVAGVVGVHYAGNTFNISVIQRFCKKNKLYFIEDAAQGYGCFYKNKALGTFGDFGTFSFHETKNIHCGLGGALICKEEDDLSLATYIAERGSNRSDLLKGLVDKYTWVSVGGSYTLSEISASFLYPQLMGFKSNFLYRKKLWNQYYINLNKSKNKLFRTIQLNKDVSSNYHAFYLIFKTNNLCDEYRSKLLEQDIHAYIGYVPLHSSPFAKSSKKCFSSDLTNTSELAERILRLPLHNNLTKIDINKVTKLLLENEK